MKTYMLGVPLRSRRLRPATVAAATLLAGWCAVGAAAGTIQFGGATQAATSGLGSYSGSVDYSYSGSGNVGSLIVSLTNTSSAANGGFITGFLFNFATSSPTFSMKLNSVVGAQSSQGWAVPRGNGLNGAPFGGAFMSGVALGGNFEGGGNPDRGIAVGHTGIFNLTVTAVDAASLTASDFLNGGGYAGAPDYTFDLVVRFRGFNDGGSDKVPGVAMQESVVLVPLPAPVWMAGVGLLGVVGWRRLRRVG